MTLHDELKQDLCLAEPETKEEREANEIELATIKNAFKKWLGTVGLPDYWSLDRDSIRFNVTESLRKLLIILVDEP